jgi:hypothetical protein
MRSGNKDAGHMSPALVRFGQGDVLIHSEWAPAGIIRQGPESMFQFGDRCVVQAGWQQA